VHPALDYESIMTQSTSSARRDFLKFLAGSPYVAALGGVAAFMERTGLAQTPQGGSAVISSPAEAEDVFDFEEAAHRKILPGHWAYMSSGVDDDGTIRANRDGYQHIQLRPRRLHDATKVDMKVSFFGTTYDSPVFTCPTGHEGAIHHDSEVAVAGACKARNTLQILSIATTTPSEDVMKARGGPVWQQLYVPNNFEVTQKVLDRIQAAGSPTLVITCDNTTGRHMETYLRTRPKDLNNACGSCHQVKGSDVQVGNTMFSGIDMKGSRMGSPELDWDFVDRIRKYWKGKLFLKGLDTREDARMAVDHGIDGILVSNHGGRATNTLRATVQALPEIVAEVKGKITIFVDGGVRRGTDVFKALALGAKGVGIGRPFLWGLGAFGQPGVDRVLEIMQAELRMAMGNCGTRTVADITRDHVAIPRDWEMS
jgi:4-hydroxymandelate oxidase